jgi:DNA-binding MarR family transcriptional regulator
METTEHELKILEQIAQRADTVHQRDLARVVGLSLGMTNAIVRRLAQKGWLTIRKVNNRNIRYVVSPAGIEQITRRSYQYFRRTIKNIVYYREAIERFVQHVRACSYSGLLLVGRSDLDFIIEHACGAYGIDYVRNERKTNSAGRGQGGLFVLYSESYMPDEAKKRSRPAVAFLQDVVDQRPVAG